MNPCPCGYQGLGDGRCSCTPRRVQGYRGRLSGPLLDRLDMRIPLRPVPSAALLDDDVQGEPSASVLARVVAARERQRTRWPAVTGSNGQAPDAAVRSANAYSASTKRLLLKLVTSQRLSARAIRRLERVARTVADLAGDAAVGELHLMEAMGFRLGGEMESRVEVETGRGS